MKTNITTISLTQTLFNVMESAPKLTPKSCISMIFDQRHDFMLDQKKPVLIAAMVFTNERALYSDRPKGARRSVTISLIDKKTRQCLSSSAVRVCMSAKDVTRTFTACLPFDIDAVEYGHIYVVEVRDDKNGMVLGEDELHFFSPKFSIFSILDCYNPEFGGVIPENSTSVVRAFDADTMVYHRLWFTFEVPNWLSALPFLPEVEVRVYYANGDIDTRFMRLSVDRTDGKIELCELETFFFLTRERSGLCYVEVVLFDNAVAGFVFHTCYGSELPGVWGRADSLAPLDAYSLSAASARFRADSLDFAEDEKAADENSPLDELDDDDIELDDDAFERAINEFIAAEKEDDSEENEESENKASSGVDADVHPSLQEALDRLTGLKSVKEKLLTYEKLMLFNKMRREHGLVTHNLPLHAMFLGSPGTGKTTVAARMGFMLKRLGVLSKGHVVRRQRSTLLGPNYSMEETNTLKAIEEAQGGILFIDEAYQLYQPQDPRDPGRFVIETLLTALSDESKRDWMLILAGYTDEMKRMFEMNPGLKSRIPDSNIYIFDDFTEAELLEIAERYFQSHNYSLSTEARKALTIRLGGDYSHRDRSFGNARHVINLIETEIIPLMAARVVSSEDTVDLTKIQSCDIPQPKNFNIKPRSKMGYCA